MCAKRQRNVAIAHPHRTLQIFEADIPSALNTLQV